MDVCLALDLVRATYDQGYEAAIIVSQDWDFGPAVRLAKEIARAQGRRLVFESCFPADPGSPFTERGAGNDLGSDRPGDLRRLPRFEGLSPEEAVNSLASEGESHCFAVSDPLSRYLEVWTATDAAHTVPL